ncbi:MAG: formate dehydrogenase maturation protein FdhE [Crocinitomicaceae bacterium]|jgi:formate dehydrogenase maturation protein FdhE
MKSLKTTSSSLLLLAFLFVAPFSFSQDNGGDQLSRKEKIERLKIAFITKELDLSVDQSEKFWPVYNEMEKKIDEQKKARRTTAKDLKENLETLSESDIKKKTNSVLDNDIKTAQLKKEYNDKIAAIIGYKKATKLLSLEARFKRELLKKLNDRSQDRPNQGARKPGAGGKGGQNGPRSRTNR